MNKFVLGGLAVAILMVPPTASAQDKGKPKEFFREEGTLTDKEPRDNAFKKSFQKTHTVKLEANQFIRIDLKSQDFDAYLRLLDEAGKVLAEDDDAGGSLNSRIIYTTEKAGTYKLVVTTYDGDKTGKYLLTVVEGGPREKLLLRAGKFAALEKKDKISFIDELKKHLAATGKDTTKEDLSLAAGIGSALEQLAPDLAVDAYGDFGALLGKSGDPVVSKFAATLTGAARRLKLPGQEMVVKGTTLEGKPFDWKAYRGKVVLIDFWATWCAPCRAELPNILKLHETYKDQGFEVVGISLDQNRDQLEKFIQAKKLPWVCLHEKKVEDNPMVEMYGIMMIPLAVLVDRDGKVISTHAHGAELARLLEKHMAAQKGK